MGWPQCSQLPVQCGIENVVKTSSKHRSGQRGPLSHDALIQELLGKQQQLIKQQQTLLNQIIIVNGWPTPQIARKKANRGGASQIQEHTY